jgi:L-2-hydroxyglutarate oxidase
MPGESTRYDIAVIGGGIVGMASAMSLLETGVARRGGGGSHPIVVLEAENTLAAHQTGRNSGVIHSGLYYKPGSLKATLCARGKDEMFRFCKERGVKHERCGKIVVATHAGELPALEELERRGKANGLGGVRRCSREELREHEPHVNAVAGLHVPETGIVQYPEVTRAMAMVVGERGGLVRTGARVLAVTPDGNDFVLTTSGGEVRCGAIVNCAGLQCDRIARLCGVEPGIRIIPFRGEYYDLHPHAWHLCRNLIYPVPDARFPFLGVHFTRAVDGLVEAGPNAVLAMAREGYTWGTVNPDDIASYLWYSGFWKMAAKYWKMGMMEMRRSLHRELFVRAMQTLIPEIRDSDVTPGRAGVRAQAVDPDGKLIDDFRIVQGPRMVHVLNAPSPAATASIAIGRHVAEIAGGVFR